jgi:hypothetical protein
VRFRSRGGGDELWNLLFVCGPQHLEGIHALGSIRVTGRAPNMLVAELGIRPDGTALETFIRRPSRGVDAQSVPAAALSR